MSSKSGLSSQSERDDSVIPNSYITILQPTVTPNDLLSSILKGYKPTFTYGTIFIGFAVDRVPAAKAYELRLDPRVLKVVENRIITNFTNDLLIDVLQHDYTVVNRETGELYDVRELDGTAPYRYSILPLNMIVPNKARQLLGINKQNTRLAAKAAKVMGHAGAEVALHQRDGVELSKKAAMLLGISENTIPMAHPPAPLKRRSSSRRSIAEENRTKAATKSYSSTESQNDEWHFNPAQDDPPGDDSDTELNVPYIPRQRSSSVSASKSPYKPAQQSMTYSTDDGERSPVALWKKESRRSFGSTASSSSRRLDQYGNS